MTTTAFDQSVTDEINRRVNIYARQDEPCACGVTVPHRHEQRDIAPHIAKIPLRSELRALEQAARAYEENAIRHDFEAEYLRRLAREAREQAANLKRMGDL